MAGRRGPYAKGRERRELILRSALDVVARDGYHGALLRDVAREVGMTPAGLLHHFGTKEDLLVEVLRTRDAVAREVLGGSDVDLEPFVLRVAQHNLGVPGLVRLYASFSAEAAGDPGHPGHRFFLDRFDAVRGSVAADIRARQRRGTCAPDVDADAVASLLIALSDGLQLQWIRDPGFDLVGHLRLAWERLTGVPPGR